MGGLRGLRTQARQACKAPGPAYFLPLEESKFRGSLLLVLALVNRCGGRSPLLAHRCCGGQRQA